MDIRKARPLATALHMLVPPALVLLLIAVVLGALAGATLWLLRTGDGSRWLLDRLPGIEVQGLHGALLGDHIEADRVRITWSGGRTSVTLVGFVGDGMRWTWRPRPDVWVELEARRLTAREVRVDSGGPTDRKPAAPASLALPARVAIAELRVDELRIDQLPPLRRVSGRMAIGDGGRHQVEDLRFESDRLTVQGRARIDTGAPFALAGELQAKPADGSFDVTLRAGGTLERIALDATLRGRALKDRPAPSADVLATVLPFAAWPLATLAAETQALDLSALVGSAPQTRLSGRVDVQTSAKDAPVGAAARLSNALPGRWDERRLPVRQITLDVVADPKRPDRIELREIDLQLGSGTRGAGRLRGKGAWTRSVVGLQAALEGVQPQQLDGRLAKMTLAGPFALTLDGLPSPDPAAASAPRPPWTMELKTTLDGRLDAAPLPVRLVLDVTADERRIELRDLQAKSGSASTRVQARARRVGAGDWQVATTGSLADFDPLPWWPGEAGSAWRQGPHRLTAEWQLDVRVPAAARQLTPLVLAQSLAGSGSLHVHDSTLAGVPVALDLTLGQAPSTEGTPGSLRGALRLGANRVDIDGRGDPMGPGLADRLHLEFDAPALAALAPLLRLVPEAGAWAPKGGSAKGNVDLQGRWPLLRSEGQVQLQRVEVAELAVAQGSARWRLQIDGEGHQPLELTAEFSGVRLGRQRVEQLRAELSGTLREHRIVMSGALPLAPPPVVEQLFGVKALAGSRAQLQGEGAWAPAPGGGGRWRGRVERLAVGAWDGGALDSETVPSWVDAHDLSAELEFGADGNLAQLRAAPGRVRLAQALALRWDAVEVDLTGSQPNIDLRADIETFAVAPLLARAQPAFGWKGDLRLAARVEVRAADRFDADIVLERRDGDLQVADEAGTQALGLTDLRIALAAHDGTWVFSQALAGRALGEMAGALSVRTTPERRWPGADAPIEGIVQARVANLGIWGAWVPPGWRLAGELQTQASIGGTWGAPEYTGQIRGSEIAVRNLLQGVNISQGTVAIALKGSSAQIERFTLKGGDGTLTVTGGADFGSAPNARLRLEMQRFRLLGRVDRLVVASGAADVALQLDRVAVDGGVVVDEGLFDTSRRDAPALDDDVTVRRSGDEEAPALGTAPPRVRRDIVLNFDVDLGTKLRVRGRGLDTALRGQLRLTTPGGRLNVQGSVSTAAGGTYSAYGQKLDIDRGVVAFNGGIDNPRLDILALRQNIDLRVGVEITGNLLTPRVRLYSETDLSDTEKLSWMMLGRGSEGLGRNDAALLQSAAMAVLAGEGDAPGSNIVRSFGLDELSVRQGDTDVRETVVTVGKQLSRRWYVGYERGVNAASGTFQLIYRIAQRFTLRAQSGSENSLDLIWTWKFDELPVPPPMRKSPATPP